MIIEIAKNNYDPVRLHYFCGLFFHFSFCRSLSGAFSDSGLFHGKEGSDVFALFFTHGFFACCNLRRLVVCRPVEHDRLFIAQHISERKKIGAVKTQKNRTVKTLPGAGQGTGSVHEGRHAKKFVLSIIQIKESGIFRIHGPKFILIIGYFSADIRHKSDLLFQNYNKIITSFFRETILRRWSIPLIYQIHYNKFEQDSSDVEPDLISS